MSRLFETFSLVSARVIAGALALVAVPILAFVAFVAFFTPVAVLAFRRGRGRVSFAGFERARPTANRHPPLIIETTYRRLDPGSRR